MNVPIDHYHRKTRFALVMTNLLSEPLFTMYNLASFILCKDLGATAFQIAIFIMLRPLVSIFSLYWSADLSEKKDKLKSNFLTAGFLSRFLFLFFPFVENIWFIIISSAIYLLFYRAGIPAWMEILKLNLPDKSRGKIFSLGSALAFIENCVLAIGFGKLLDQRVGSWKFLFFFCAILGMINLIILSRIPIKQVLKTEPSSNKNKISFFNKLKKPWKESFRLLREQKDFAKFQWGYMVCGFGIMLVQPALPIFFKDTLQLTYTDLAIALSVYKSLGFAISSPIWGKNVHRESIMKLSSIVFIFVGMFPFLLILSPLHHMWLYLAYFFYGIAQGGSHLIWNLSGPVFAEKQHSTNYSGVNVVMVGIRGAVAPPLGSLLSFSPILTFLFGSLFCFYGGAKLFYDLKKKPKYVDNSL